MSMVTKQEILEFWKKHETPEAKEERREVEALKKDLRIAQDSIQDAIARYRKATLRARLRPVRRIYFSLWRSILPGPTSKTPMVTR